jgi:predicted nucleic acid-binding protein/Arc/MetJ-type ribon-helix-helix transcriptional regulator
LTTTIELDGYLERRLDLLVSLGLYSTKSEVVRDAIRHLLDRTEITSITLGMYRKGLASFGFCAEASELSYDEVLSLMQRKGIKPRLGPESLEEVEDEARALALTDNVVFEALPLIILSRVPGLDMLHKLSKKFWVTQQETEVLPFETRRSVLRLMKNPEKALSVITGVRGYEDISVRGSLSLGEASAIAAALKAKGVLVADDQRTRAVAKELGCTTASTPAVLLYLEASRVLGQKDALAVYENLLSLGYALPYQFPELGRIAEGVAAAWKS